MHWKDAFNVLLFGLPKTAEKVIDKRPRFLVLRDDVQLVKLFYASRKSGLPGYSNWHTTDSGFFLSCDAALETFKMASISHIMAYRDSEGHYWRVQEATKIHLHGQQKDTKDAYTA
jgi:hypothetical protein